MNFVPPALSCSCLPLVRRPSRSFLPSCPSFLLSPVSSLVPFPYCSLALFLSLLALAGQNSRSKSDFPKRSAVGSVEIGAGSIAIFSLRRRYRTCVPTNKRMNERNKPLRNQSIRNNFLLRYVTWETAGRNSCRFSRKWRVFNAEMHVYFARKEISPSRASERNVELRHAFRSVSRKKVHDSGGASRESAIAFSSFQRLLSDLWICRMEHSSHIIHAGLPKVGRRPRRVRE